MTTRIILPTPADAARVPLHGSRLRDGDGYRWDIDGGTQCRVHITDARSAGDPLLRIWVRTDSTCRRYRHGQEWTAPTIRLLLEEIRNTEEQARICREWAERIAVLLAGDDDDDGDDR